MPASFRHPYWTAPVSTRPQKFLKPMLNNLGWNFNIPHEDPVTAGFYYGEQPGIYGRRTIVTRSDPEYYTVSGNIMPSVNGIPRMDPYSREMRFSREDYTKKVASV